MSARSPHQPREVVNKVNVQGTLQVGDPLFARLSDYPYPAEFVMRVSFKGSQEYRDENGAVQTRVLNLKVEKFEAT